jgi:hypothetical protein
LEQNKFTSKNAVARMLMAEAATTALVEAAGAEGMAVLAARAVVVFSVMPGVAAALFHVDAEVMSPRKVVASLRPHE